MAYTQADLDSLDEAIKTGAIEVRFQDRTVRYNSTDELLKLRNFIANKVSTTPIIRQVRMRTCKGF